MPPIQLVFVVPLYGLYGGFDPLVVIKYFLELWKMKNEIPCHSCTFLLDPGIMDKFFHDLRHSAYTFNGGHFAGLSQPDYILVFVLHGTAPYRSRCSVLGLSRVQQRATARV